MENLPELSKGWVWTRLGEACLDPQYGWTTSAVTEGILHLLRTTDITSGSIDWNTVPFCKEEPSEKEKYLLKDGDIVISRAGSVGYSHLIKNPKEAIFASYLIRFRPLIDEKYLAFFLKSPLYWNSISEKSLGIAIPNVNASKLKQIPHPLPPLPEQHRIVAKIEEVFTKLDAGDEALKKIKTQLKRYRQSVLKFAMEGKLTEEWRKEHKHELEPASVLLERIEKERKKKIKGKYKELPSLDTSSLPELPEGWVWTRLEKIIKDIDNANPKIEPEKEFIYLDINSIDNTQQKITTPKRYLGKDAPSRAKQIVKTGDILFSTVRTYLKNIAMVDEIYNGQIASTGFCVIRPNPTLDRQFIFQLVQMDFFLNPLTQIQRGTSYPAVRDSDVFAQPTPLPPAPEQRKIVEEIEKRFTVADEVKKTVEQSLKQAERLRQSILKKAFEGKLVPQDSTDEPASILLERIKKEKERLEAERKAKRKGRMVKKRKSLKQKELT